MSDDHTPARVPTVLLTGGNGFIGRHVAQALASQGVRCDTTEGKDLTQPGVLEIWPGHAWVVHLAGSSSVSGSWTDPGAAYASNLVTTLNALEYCRRHSAALLLASTVQVYGIPERLPLTEDHLRRPRSPYAASKALAEDAAFQYADLHAVRGAVLRLSNVYGPGMKPGTIIHDLLSQIHSPEPVRVQNLAPRRDYLWVEDLVDLMMRVLHAPASPMAAYNVGSGRTSSPADLLEAMFAATGRSQPIEETGPKRPNEILDIAVDVKASASAFGWRARTTMAQGIEACLKQWDELG